MRRRDLLKLLAGAPAGRFLRRPRRRRVEADRAPREGPTRPLEADTLRRPGRWKG